MNFQPPDAAKNCTQIHDTQQSPSSSVQCLLQEPTQRPTNVLQVEQEGIVTEHGDILAELNVLNILVAASAKRVGNLTLLPCREKDLT